jgi:glycosyltransferase involved in cell wall biosynthesis
MKKPLVSVVLPTFNSERFIREAIHSIIEQKYTRFELIIVDGGSTDSTIELVESYCDDEDDLKLIKQPKGRGNLPQSLNAGLAAAKGEFIARMDADDVASPWRLNDQVWYLIQNIDVSLIGTGADLFGDAKSVCRSPLSHSDILNTYLINNPFFHPTIMFRRRLYDEGLFYYNENHPCEEDYELWGRILPKIRSANLDQSSISYRIHENNAQYDPRRYEAKKISLTAFCKMFDIHSGELVNALAEFQCGSFVRREVYHVMHDYALSIEGKDLPKLGWIHDAMLACESHVEFQRWYYSVKGWPFQWLSR